MSKLSSEKQLHTRCVGWFRCRFPNSRLMHARNDAIGSHRGCENLKMGVSKGFPDLLLFINGKIIAIEFKAKTGQVSEEQESWIQFLKIYGIYCFVVRSFEDFKGITEKAAES